LEKEKKLINSTISKAAQAQHDCHKFSVSKQVLGSLSDAHLLKQRYKNIKFNFSVKNKSLEMWKLRNQLLDLDNDRNGVRGLEKWLEQHKKRNNSRNILRALNSVV